MLAYLFVANGLDSRDVYVEEVIAHTSDHLHSLAIRLGKEVSRSNGILYTVWLPPAKVACIRFMNDPRSLSWEVVTADERRMKARSENVKFVDRGSARSDCNNFDTVSVRATRNIGLRKQIFAAYRENYDFK